MKKVLPFLFASIFLAACTHVPKTAFKDSELYQGYPCRDHCGEFKQGYDLAMNQKLTQDEQCISENLEVNTGCKAYLSDYRFEHKKDDLYLE